MERARIVVDGADDDLPAVLAEAHRGLPVGGRLDLRVRPRGDGLPNAPTRADLVDLVVGAGFDVDEVDDPAGPGAALAISATRARTLPDTVAPGLRLLVCGLNPSVYSADAGVGFARPGNRFWPALAAAGIDDVDRSPRLLLARHAIGMTDLVKRATPRADELTRAEYRDGLARVRRLADRFGPAAVCFVGLAGWRAAVDRRAVAGWQPDGALGDTPAYVMPSTSGLNAATSLDTLAVHLRAALAGPKPPPPKVTLRSRQAEQPDH